MSMSILPAVYMAPSCMRRLYQSTSKGMDDDIDDPALAKVNLHNIDHCDGKTWIKAVRTYMSVHACY